MNKTQKWEKIAQNRYLLWVNCQAELAAAEKRIAELKNDPTSEWREAVIEKEHKLEAAEKRIAELEEALSCYSPDHPLLSASVNKEFYVDS